MPADWGRALTLEPVRGLIAIAGVGETQHSASSGRDPVDMALEAVARAIADAGLKPSDVDGLMIQPFMAGQLTTEIYRRHFGITHDLWVSDQGGAMTWAGSAPYHAALAIRDKRARVVVNVFSIDWASQRKAETGGPGDYHRGDRFKANFELPFGYYPQPVYFAQTARRHMFEYGTTAEQLGAIAVSSRAHANGHPGAVMYDKPLTLEDYLARKPFIDPLRIEDCCLISDGAAAYVMTSVEQARDLPHPPAIVLGVGQAVSDYGTYFALQPEFLSTPHIYSAPAAFAMAGIAPLDVDVLTIYDPFTIAALIQIEDMGFCKKGEGGAFVIGDRLSHKRPRAAGGLPFNTHGGLLSHAYLLGISHVVEIVHQLRGTAHNQVKDARIGVYGGYTGESTSTLVLGQE
jgi:acetyl-CoA acetyltransferase